MKVSFIVIAYNEEKTIKNLLGDIANQNYPHQLIEVILIDGLSTDTTKKIMEEFSKENNDFMRVVVKDNPKRTLPCGWNIALSESNNDLIIRVDAHSSIPSDFITKNVECIKSGEKICGGYRPNIIDEETPWKKTLLLAETSMFGSSIATYRRNSGKRYVNSVFHGAYSREVFEKVGLYNELLARTEDNEMHYRIRKAGYRLCYDPQIHSWQYVRSSVPGMMKQKYGNGEWVARTLGVCPGCLSIYHFVPFAFVLAIIVTTILAAVKKPFLAITMWITYWCGAIGMAVLAVKNEAKHICQLLLPGIFFLLHLSYGVGSVVGMTKMIKDKFTKK